MEAANDFTSVVKGSHEAAAAEEVAVKVINHESEDGMLQLTLRAIIFPYSVEVTKKSAIAEGEEVDIYAFRNIGFLMQYFAVGLIYGGLPATIYGFFLGYLNVPGYIYATASVQISASYKTVDT
eukprot:g2392.t1